MSIFKRVKKLEEMTRKLENWDRFSKEQIKGLGERIGPRYHAESITAQIEEILRHLEVKPGLRSTKRKKD